MSAGGDPDVLLEVVIDGLLRHDTALLVGDGALDIFEPVVDTPEVKRNMLALVADDDLGGGEAVKDSVRDQTQSVQGDTIGE